MIFSEPMSFDEALDAAEIKTVLPTSGRTADMQRLDKGIKQRALWSATLESIKALQQIGDMVKGVLSGAIDQASAMLEVKHTLESEGYRAPDEDKGTMLDLASVTRRRTIIETQVSMARGAGWHEQGMQEDVLDEFPAQELFRAIRPAGGADAQRDWGQRWIDAGGPPAKSGRMIALKTDPVWSRLGDPELFGDGLGNEWPPFAFHSGMRVRDIGRDEAESLGLLNADTRLTPQPLDFAADLSAKPAIREQWLKDAITESGLASFDESGVLHFTGGETA